MKRTAAALMLAMVLAVYLIPQPPIRTTPQPSGKAQVTKPTVKEEPPRALTPSFKKAAKLALRTLDRQRNATITEASDYAHRRLRRDYYPASCNVREAFRDSPNCETMQRETERAMAEA